MFAHIQVNVQGVRYPDDCPAVGKYELVFVIANTIDGRPRHTQQEHFLSKCPLQRFEIWNSDDLFFKPRVPIRGIPANNQRYVRIAASDITARLFSEHQCMEAVLHGKFVSRRSA